MSEEEFKQKCEDLMEGIYKICIALVSITEHECCSYGFDNECDSAEKFIEKYEENHGRVDE